MVVFRWTVGVGQSWNRSRSSGKQVRSFGRAGTARMAQYMVCWTWFLSAVRAAPTAANSNFHGHSLQLYFSSVDKFSPLVFCLVKFLPLYIRLVNAILQLVARYLIFRTTFNDRLISSCRLVESTTSMLSRRVTVKSLDLIQSLVECCSRLQKLSVSDLVLLLDRTSLLAIFGRLVVGSGRRRVATAAPRGG